MLANFEQREHKGRDSVWAGRYENLHNLPHWHMECELLYVEKGQVTVSLNNAAHSLEEGDAFFIDSREIHYIKGSPSSITEIIMFDSRLLDEIDQGHRPQSPRLSCGAFIPDYYGKIREELDCQNPYFDLKVRSLLLLLMLEIFRKEPLAAKKKAGIILPWKIIRTFWVRLKRNAAISLSMTPPDLWGCQNRIFPVFLKPFPE